jgi:hypothetical protein
MAKDEMETITEDRWDEDLWCVEHDVSGRRPKLVFYFGEKVHNMRSTTKLHDG